MISKKLQQAFNEQINKELFSEYLYLAMKNFFEELNLSGFVNWFDVQMQEERAHAVGLYSYLLQRGGKVTFEAIDKPVVTGTCPLSVFEQTLAHEEFVTSRINALADAADEDHDRAAVSFLDWYIKEQVEEEDNVRKIIANLKLIGDDKKALLMLDKDLAARTFVAPVIG